MAEQTALYRFTDRLHRATSRQEIYSAALEAITAALGCQRASILLLDEANIMRFVASSSLSSRYRAVAEGHSPWASDAIDPAPVIVSDAVNEPFPGELKDELQHEGIGALAFIPLVSNGRLIGKFMTYYSEAHFFDEPEIALSLAIGRHLAFGIGRMQAEEALRAKDSELEAVLARTPFMIIRCDTDLRLRFASPALLQFLGLTESAVVGQSIREFIGSEAFAVLRPYLDQALRGYESDSESEVWFGSVGSRVIRGIYQPEYDTQGKLTGLIGSLLDVTDRRRADYVTKQLAAIVESSDDAIVGKDLNGVVTNWNAGAERIFGYSANEMIGAPIIAVIPEDRHDEEPAILERLRNGERVDHFETVRRRKDGILIDVSLTISPIKDAQGRIVGASKIARDITDRKRSEALLRDNERRLQELLAAIPAAIYTTDAEGTITYFNDAAVAFAGRRPTIGVDKWCVAWKLNRPDGTSLPHDQSPMAIALREGKIIRNVEAVAERPDGTRVPFIPFPTPLRDSSGKIVGGINMLVDISERKQSETHQQVLLRELNHRVKNNMQILQALLSSSLRGSTNAESRASLEDASRRVGAMAAAQQVLYGATPGTSFQVDEFLHSVCRTAQQTFAKNIKITIARAEGTLANDVAAPLALILNELITNAVKHGLKAEPGEIRVGLGRTDGDFTLFVEDDGPGFSPGRSTIRSSGLGLVQALARQLNGQLDVTRTHCTRCTVRFTGGRTLEA